VQHPSNNQLAQDRFSDAAKLNLRQYLTSTLALGMFLRHIAEVVWMFQLLQEDDSYVSCSTETTETEVLRTRNLLDT
jgi:hypothetical protein